MRLPKHFHMFPQTANRILAQTVTNYNTIGADFAATRARPWPEWNYLQKRVRNGDRVLDIGCGNGRLLQSLEGKTVRYHGIDGSESLIGKAREHWVNERDASFSVWAAPDPLPFADNCFDWVVSAAFLHHIPSQKLRVEHLREVCRVLSPESAFFLSVWNLWQKKFLRQLVHYTTKKVFGQSELDFFDLFIPYTQTNLQHKVQRYHHAFRKRELARLLRDAGFILIENCSTERNLCLVAKK